MQTIFFIEERQSEKYYSTQINDPLIDSVSKMSQIK
jgi:hypothetical protein